MRLEAGVGVGGGRDGQEEEEEEGEDDLPDEGLRGAERRHEVAEVARCVFQARCGWAGGCKNVIRRAGLGWPMLYGRTHARTHARTRVAGGDAGGDEAGQGGAHVLPVGALVGPVEVAVVARRVVALGRVVEGRERRW